MQLNQVEMVKGIVTHEVLDRLYAYYLNRLPHKGFTIESIIIVMDNSRFEKNKKEWRSETSVCLEFFDHNDDSTDCRFLRIRYKGIVFWLMTSRTYNDDIACSYPIWSYEGGE